MSDDKTLIVQAVGVPTKPLMSRDPRLKGVSIPVRNKPPFDDAHKVAWQAAIEDMMGSGLTSTIELAKASGLSTKAVRGFRDSVLEGWGATMTPSLVNTRRETLYSELEAVKRAAWEYFNDGLSNGADAKEQGAWLKLLMDAMDRQARISGVNTQQVSAEVSVVSRIKTAKELQQEAEQRLNLPQGQLDLIGEELAKQLSLHHVESDDE